MVPNPTAGDERGTRGRPATMADVAERAGVSKATVSHYLNETRRLLPETRERVKAAIDELAYLRDPTARTLRAGSTNVVGLAMSAVTNPYFSALAQGIEAGLSAAGKDILLMDTHDDPERELRVVEDLIARRVDGLVLAPSATADHAVSLAARHGIPITLVDRLEPQHRCDQTAVEGRDAMRRITAHLLERGHERVGLISGESGLPTTEERVAGFRAAFEEAGLPDPAAWIRSGSSTRAGGSAAAAELLDAAAPPTALIAANNAMTIGALRQVKDRGLRIPSDLAFACYDDFEWADLFEPGLTAVAQPIDDLAAATVRLLLTRTSDPALEARRIQLEPTIMHRTSCGCEPGTPFTTP